MKKTREFFSPGAKATQLSVGTKILFVTNYSGWHCMPVKTIFHGVEELDDHYQALMSRFFSRPVLVLACVASSVALRAPIDSNAATLPAKREKRR